MRSWFESLEERERIFVLAGAAAILIGTFWIGVWTPLDSGQKSAAVRVDTWRVSLAELRPLKSQIQDSGSGQTVQAGQNQPLVVIVDSTLRQRGLYSSLQRSQPTPTGDGYWLVGDDGEAVRIAPGTTEFENRLQAALATR